jgi:hypothetical protein
MRSSRFRELLNSGVFISRVSPISSHESGLKKIIVETQWPGLPLVGAFCLRCERCGRKGRYRLQSLIAERGGDASVVDWLAELTADCSRKQAQNWNDRCAARCPDLPKVL